MKDLAEKLRHFAAERDWEVYHSPKNLSMALAAEAGELLEHFQWLTDKESRELPDTARQAAAEEMADVFIYLVRLADVTGVDLMREAARKVALNEKKYPVRLARGKADKYTELGAEKGTGSADGDVP
jgi:NTP pyrophosphatase (non-canonical NTP hydrolase)